MPSNGDPISYVQPGPGRLPAGTVPAGAILAPSGGGGGGGSNDASLVHWIGNGPWADGTTNPATSVGSELTKIITDLTHATAAHTGADRISAGPTGAPFVDSSTPSGGTVQALLGSLVTLLSQQVFGSSATITVAGPTVTVTGLSAMTAAMVGQNLVVYSSSQSANVGIWPIATFISSSSVTITNGAAVTDTGSDSWYVATGADRVAARVTQAHFADTQAAIGESVQALIEYVVAYLGGSTGAGATGSAAITGNPNTLGAGSVHSQLTSLLGFANAVTSFTRTLTSSHTLDDGSSPDRVVVLNGSGSFNFTLTNPSLNTGRKILLVDTTGILATAPVTLVRFGSEKIAGTAANYSLRVPYGNWVISCDGTNWFVQQGASDFYNERVVGPSADSLDSAGYRDETVYLAPSVLSFNFSLPDLTVTPSLGRGRRVYLIDQNGNLGVSPVLLVPVGSQTINGVAAPFVLNSPWATYLLQSDGNGWFVSAS